MPATRPFPGGSQVTLGVRSVGDAIPQIPRALGAMPVPKVPILAAVPDISDVPDIFPASAACLTYSTNAALS